MNSVLISESLRSSLQLTQNPIGIAFTAELPPNVPRWDSTVPAGCRFWQEAATRVFATESRDHALCAIGVYTHHLETAAASETDLADALAVFADLEYVRPEDVADIPVLGSRPTYVIYAPLESLPVPADVVLLFARANQTLILCEAA
jgi:uncharacterized protein (DUF169 family)